MSTLDPIDDVHTYLANTRGRPVLPKDASNGTTAVAAGPPTSSSPGGQLAYHGCFPYGDRTRNHSGSLGVALGVASPPQCDPHHHASQHSNCGPNAFSPILQSGRSSEDSAGARWPAVATGVKVASVIDASRPLLSRSGAIQSWSDSAKLPNTECGSFASGASRGTLPANRPSDKYAAPLSDDRPPAPEPEEPSQARSSSAGTEIYCYHGGSCRLITGSEAAFEDHIRDHINNDRASQNTFKLRCRWRDGGSECGKPIGVGISVKSYMRHIRDVHLSSSRRELLPVRRH